MKECHNLSAELESPELKETITSLLNKIPKILSNKRIEST